ncbi:MAG: hypothetical protein CMB48_07365 [Euryarchaeota archaeon]|nr:hypothetical protein [Euryarchaeota archaeon]
MPRGRVSENKNDVIKTGIAFCSETGERLDKVRYNTKDLIRKSQCKNTWAQGVVKALFENEPSNQNLKHTAESILSNLHSRASESESFPEKETALPENFAQLEKRTKKIKIRKVKKDAKKPEIDQNLMNVIESIIDEKIAQA